VSREADLLAADANLEELTELLPRVGLVLDVSRSNRRLLAGPDPGEAPLCDEPDHRAQGFREPCLACRVWADRHGRVPAMGAVLIRTAVIDAVMDAELMLQDLERRVVEHLVVAPYPSRMVTAVGRAKRLRELLAFVEDQALVARAAADTSSAVGALSHAIDGEATVRLPAPCPHCGRRTLVAFLAEDIDQRVIRCNRKASEICVCSSPDCRCHDGKRHEWWYTRGRGLDGEWGVLARLLEQAG
jgi:hypothetical protein